MKNIPPTSPTRGMEYKIKNNEKQNPLNRCWTRERYGKTLQGGVSRNATDEKEKKRGRNGQVSLGAKVKI